MVIQMHFTVDDELMDFLDCLKLLKLSKYKYLYSLFPTPITLYIAEYHVILFIQFSNIVIFISRN